MGLSGYLVFTGTGVETYSCRRSNIWLIFPEKKKSVQATDRKVTSTYSKVKMTLYTYPVFRSAIKLFLRYVEILIYQQ